MKYFVRLTKQFYMAVKLPPNQFGKTYGTFENHTSRDPVIFLALLRDHINVSVPKGYFSLSYYNETVPFEYGSTK